MAKVELKHLAGLEHRSSKGEKDEKGKMIYTPVKRPLVLDDITGQVDNGDSFVITTTDGRKYTVPKKAAVEAAPDEGKDDGKK